MKKYQIIYADCPWRYDFSKSNSRKIENQYPTMSLEDIKELKIPSDSNSIMFFWATAPKLIEALEVIKAWGFTYKTHGVWDKEIIGMGYWFRSQHEDLLVATKGQPPLIPTNKRVSSILKSRREQHSSKPQLVIDLIDEWYPNLAKLELFARRKRFGWDCWGNEVESDIELNTIS